jgi:hypothetical protein
VDAIDAVGNVDPTPAARTFTIITGLATLVDADHDGFPAGLDCDERAAAVHPGAREVPGNRIDENCDGLLAPFPPITATVSSGGRSDERATTFTRLVVTGAPAGAKVQLRCTAPKRACPFSRRTLGADRGRANALATLGRRQRRIPVGAMIEVRVTAPAMIGKVVRFPIVKAKFPRGQTSCLDPGAPKPRACAVS